MAANLKEDIIIGGALTLMTTATDAKKLDPVTVNVKNASGATEKKPFAEISKRDEKGNPRQVTLNTPDGPRYFTRVNAIEPSEKNKGFRASAWVEMKGDPDTEAGKQIKDDNVIFGFPGYSGGATGLLFPTTGEQKAIVALKDKAVPYVGMTEVNAFIGDTLNKPELKGRKMDAVFAGHSAGTGAAQIAEAAFTINFGGRKSKVLLLEEFGAPVAREKEVKTHQAAELVGKHFMSVTPAGTALGGALLALHHSNTVSNSINAPTNSVTALEKTIPRVTRIGGDAKNNELVGGEQFSLKTEKDLVTAHDLASLIQAALDDKPLEKIPAKEPEKQGPPHGPMNKKAVEGPTP